MEWAEGDGADYIFGLVAVQRVCYYERALPSASHRGKGYFVGFGVFTENLPLMSVAQS
jgi:hypothetical protein